MKDKKTKKLSTRNTLMYNIRTSSPLLPALFFRFLTFLCVVFAIFIIKNKIYAFLTVLVILIIFRILTYVKVTDIPMRSIFVDKILKKIKMKNRFKKKKGGMCYD